MHLDSLSFVFLFLPLSILVYYAVPLRFKNLTLLGVSLLFYFLLEPINILILLLSIVTDFLLSVLMRLNDEDPLARKAVLAASVVKNLFLIAYCGVLYQTQGITAPVGIQIYSISALDYMLGIYRREDEYETDFIKFALYCSFFPRLFAGPVVRWRDLAPQLARPVPSLSSISLGVLLFCGGLAKKLLLADALYELYKDTVAIREVTLLSSWLLAFSALFYMYFMLSAYCDMARGIARMLSIQLPRNMNYPFSAGSLRAFLSRFNVTVGDFIKNALRTLDTKTKAGHAFYTLFVCALMGLWFGLSPNMLAWGLLLGLMVLAQDWLAAALPERPPAFLAGLLTVLLVLFSFAFFATPTLSAAGKAVLAMVGLGGEGKADSASLYLLLSRYPVIIAAPLLSTRLALKAGSYLKKRTPALYAVLTICACAALCALGVLYLL